MATSLFTPLFRCNYVIHVLKKCQLILILLPHLTLSPFKLDYKQNMDFPISFVCILLLSWGPVVPAGVNKIQSCFAQELEWEVLFGALQRYQILCVWGIFFQRGKQLLQSKSQEAPLHDSDSDKRPPQAVASV